MITTNIQLFDAIDQYFLQITKLVYPTIFTQAERQVEGWFKGELLHLFASLKEQGQIAQWDCETHYPNLGKRKCDFVITVNGLPVYLEIKVLYHGRQRGFPVDLSIYFNKDDIGIWPDVQKLASIATAQCFCLLYIYPAPPQTRWQQVLTAFAQKIAPLTIQEVSTLPQYPPSLAIIKLKIC